MSVLSVSRSVSHNFSKDPTTSITLIEGLGVEGDCHAGVTGESPTNRDPPAIFRHSYFETFFVEFGKITGLKLNFRYFMVCSNP
jgi:hypothetical protein